MCLYAIMGSLTCFPINADSSSLQSSKMLCEDDSIKDWANVQNNGPWNGDGCTSFMKCRMLSVIFQHRIKVDSSYKRWCWFVLRWYCCGNNNNNEYY